MRKSFLYIIIVFITFLCSGCLGERNFTVSYIVNEGGRISGGATQEVKKGESANIVKAVNESNYHFVKWSDGITTEKRTDTNITNNITVEAIFERNNYNFPSFYLNTFGSSITSKEEYINCEVTINDIDYPEYSFQKAEAKIRGRGNSTWKMPKKSYKLKFEKKIDLFGNGEAKIWTLIANYCDKSLSRNYLAFKLANLLETKKVSSSTRFIELYINGSYEGVYLVCEQVECKENRVDISVDYSDVNTGYLIELDYKVYEEDAKLNIDYFLIDNIPYAIKSPDKENVEIAEYIKYIKVYFEKCIDVLKTGTFIEVEELIDVNSFAEQYLIQELFKNIDVKHSSWFLYKDRDGKLCNGPVWDMDISCGNCNYEPEMRLDYMYARYKNYWYKLLFTFPEFEEIVKKMLIEKYYDIYDCLNDAIDDLYQSKEYFDKNFITWDILGSYVWPNPNSIVKLMTWSANIEQVRTWLNQSLYSIYNYYLN